jgi:undecaprenyl-diphosphatase
MQCVIELYRFEQEPPAQTSHLFDEMDPPILTFMTGFAGKSPLFDHPLNALSRLDIFKGIGLMCLFWYTWAQAPQNELPYVREQRQKHLVLVLIGTVLIGALSRGLLLALPVHQRRPLLSGLGLNFPLGDVPTDGFNSWNSFPSDHSMFFFALGAGLWSVNRNAGLIALVWTIMVIDFPRMYLGIHYPSDVLFGALFGIAGMRIFLALPLERSMRSLFAWGHAHPGIFLAALFFITDEVGHLLAEWRELAHSSIHILG